MLKYFIFTGLFLTSTVLLADIEKIQVPFKTFGDKKEALVNKYLVYKTKDFEDGVLVTDISNNEVFSHQAFTLLNHFIEASIANFSNSPDDFLITVWGSGVHGQKMMIFNLKTRKDKPVYEYKSAWPLRYQVTSKQLEILGKGSAFGKDGFTPEDVKVRWRP